MTDSAPITDRPDADPEEPQAEPRDDAAPGFQPPSRTRYRPSEAWALRWLGTPVA